MHPFVPGQRWISDTETDLGLGTILKIEHRFITIVYMASGEVRTYSAETAPLTRVQFGAGDRITTENAESLIVTDVEIDDGLITYFCTTEAGTAKTVSETELDNFMQFNRPSDKLFNGLFDRERRYHLRLSTREMQMRLAQSEVYGLCGARVDLIPHQLYIAHEVSNRQQPRVLLADEVGLGKTIEAGMIIHRQLVREAISRVLVVVPEPLLHQWLVEMKRRFNLEFSIMDEVMYEESMASAADNNPFIDRQLVLTTLDFLTSDEKVLQHTIDAGWDTFIVDEAHHLETPIANTSANITANSTETPASDTTPRYDCVAKLSQHIGSLLLLTATPQQMGHHGHFARLQLLDPHRFVSHDKFSEEESNYRALADIAAALEKHQSLDDKQQKLLTDLQIDPPKDSADPMPAIDTMIDHHGTGRVMFRNTRRGVEGFPQRHYEPHALQQDDDASLAEWLTEFIASVAPEKLLLICSSAERVSALHEFFQFLHQMILVDLPDNADLLEQRIGRLDRIGQSQDIKIIVPFKPGSRDDFLQRWYHEGLGAFEHTCQVGELVKADLKDKFDSAINEQSGINALLDEANVVADKHKKNIESGRDRLLELSSHRAEVSNELLAQIDEFDTESALQRFMDQALDNIGVDIEDQSTHAYILKPGEHMSVAELPGLGEDGTTVTYRRHEALAREDIQFLTWEHPLVQTTMDHIITGGLGQVLVGAMQHEGLPRGGVLLEAHYVFDCPAPKALNVEQYLSAHVVRTVVSSDQGNVTETFDHDTLNEAFHSIKRSLAKRVVESKRPELQTLLASAEEIANAELITLQKQAQEKAATTLGAELERLKVLAARNQSVRDTEIKALQQTIEDTSRALSQLRCVLDTVRVFGIA